ncbi:hypothetical protein H6P81_013946 [Aristolochia fimbriata]|uniref:polynucleotide adenylyltransferase n=1 Tax=Aristolochia fimbriata TaxID=158543 RepID=A0AAV7EG39_ARIFI|nr:hypothetical protein H6P81_013946 [Aristolochia fimbriata]
MEETSFLYESAGILSGNSRSEKGQTESYTVFRNEISGAALDIVEIAADDYLSLDAGCLNADDATCPSPSPEDTPLPADSNLERAWFRGNSGFKSPMLQLHKEIVDFCEFISPTQEEQASRVAAVQRITELIKYIWPHCRVEVFGSFRTGLYLPTSDIDVVILESRVSSPQIGLYALSKGLKQRNIGKNIQVIAKARVPIIKFLERESGVAFDISFDATNGPKAAEFIKDVVAKIPPLRPLCLILKVFLQQRELNEVYSGGISSYAVLAMLIAHLKIHWGAKNFKGSETSSDHNLGILLVKFFELYGRKLNTWDVGVSCSAAGTFFLKSERGFTTAKRPCLLSIEDPQAPDNDIGKNSFNYFQIRSAFAMAYSLLTDAKTIAALGQDRSILGTIIRPDPLLLKRKGGLNGEVTFDNLLPGAGKPVERQLGNDSDVLCNWDLFEDEPFPRENGIAAEHVTSLKKRKSSRSKHKDSQDEELTRNRHEGSGRKRRGEKNRWKRYRNNEDGGVGGSVHREFVPWDYNSLD